MNEWSDDKNVVHIFFIRSSNFHYMSKTFVFSVNNHNMIRIYRNYFNKSGYKKGFDFKSTVWMLSNINQYTVCFNYLTLLWKFWVPCWTEYHFFQHWTFWNFMVPKSSRYNIRNTLYLYKIRQKKKGHFSAYAFKRCFVE